MELDDDYANASYIPDGDSYPDRWAKAARAWTQAEAAAGRLRSAVPYGEGRRERFDLLLPDVVPTGLVVFVHGGYWLKFDRSYWTHLAAGVQSRGWAMALPSYDLCPDVHIRDITRQISNAVGVAAVMIGGPVVLAGHSAGGHLVARMLEPGLLANDVVDRLRRIIPISPLSDLRPLLKTSMNTDLRLDIHEVMDESPILMTARHSVPVTVWVGADERPVFLDQARWLSEAWDADLVIAEKRHHFDVIEPLEIGDSELVSTLLG